MCGRQRTFKRSNFRSDLGRHREHSFVTVREGEMLLAVCRPAVASGIPPHLSTPITITVQSPSVVAAHSPHILGSSLCRRNAFFDTPLLHKDGGMLVAPDAAPR